MTFDQIVVAARDGDLALCRRAFTALVLHPRGEEVAAKDGRFLALAFIRAAQTVRSDRMPLPVDVCEALDLDFGASFHDGAMVTLSNEGRAHHLARFNGEHRLKLARAH